MASLSFLQDNSLVLRVLDIYLDCPIIIPVPMVHIRHTLLSMVYSHGAIRIVSDLIRPYSTHIRHLDCLIYRQDNGKFLLSIPRGLFKSMESIDIMLIYSIHNHLFPFNQSHPRICEVFNSLPSLRIARIKPLIGIHPLRFRLPWDYLTVLDLMSTYVSADAFLRILSYASERLVEGRFTVKLRSQWAHTFYMYQPIIMTGLNKLHLRILRPQFCQKFESLLVMPCLRNLWIEKENLMQHHDCYWDFNHYAHFLSPCSSTLVQLILSYFGSGIMHPKRPSIGRRTSHVEIEALFHVLPNLGDLKLPYGVPVHIPTLEKLSSGKLLPRLHSFGLAVLNPYPIFEVVQKRYYMDGPSSVYVSPIERLDLYMPVYSSNIQSSVIRDVIILGNESNSRITLRFYALCVCTLCYGH